MRITPPDTDATTCRDNTNTSTPSTNAEMTAAMSDDADDDDDDDDGAGAAPDTKTVRDHATPNSAAALTPTDGNPTTPAHEPTCVGAAITASAHDMAADPEHTTVCPRTNPGSPGATPNKGANTGCTGKRRSWAMTAGIPARRADRSTVRRAAETLMTATIANRCSYVSSHPTGLDAPQSASPSLGFFFGAFFGPPSGLAEGSFVEVGGVVFNESRKSMKPRAPWAKWSAPSERA